MTTVSSQFERSPVDNESLFPFRPSKLPLTGLVARSLDGIFDRPQDLGGVVVNAYWSKLQPTEGGNIDLSSTTNGWGDIQAALALGMPIELRLFSGKWAPDWVKAAAGSLTIVDPTGGSTFTAPKWWRRPDGSIPLLSAWNDWMMKMAALLEPEPFIQEVSSNPATTLYVEPCIRQFANAQNIYSYINGGLTTELDVEAITWPAEVVAGVPRWKQLGWTTTRLYMPFNPLQTFIVLDATANPPTYKKVTSLTSTETMIGRYALSMPRGVVIGNNSLRVPLTRLGIPYATMLGYQSGLPVCTSYQTAQGSLLTSSYQTVHPGATDLESLRATLDVAFGLIYKPDNDPENIVSSPAVRMRARKVELPSTWDASGLTSDMCAFYNAVASGNSIGV